MLRQKHIPPITSRWPTVPLSTSLASRALHPPYPASSSFNHQIFLFPYQMHQAHRARWELAQQTSQSPVTPSPPTPLRTLTPLSTHRSLTIYWATSPVSHPSSSLPWPILLINWFHVWKFRISCEKEKFSLEFYIYIVWRPNNRLYKFRIFPKNNES